MLADHDMDGSDAQQGAPAHIDVLRNVTGFRESAVAQALHVGPNPHRLMIATGVLGAEVHIDLAARACLARALYGLAVDHGDDGR